MTRGLVLGKFAPLHRGHQLLIERSQATCDETVVLVYEAREITRVPLSIRCGWIRRLYPRVRVIEGADGPSSSGRDPAVMRVQEVYIGAVVPGPVTHFFSSEWYGEHVSASLSAIDVRVDEARSQVPVSATLIRSRPSEYARWVDPLVWADFLRWDLEGKSGQTPEP